MSLRKTSELTGAALDWAVAKCEGALGRVELERINGEWAVVIPDLSCCFEPSTDWSQGGPIIDREHISATVDDSGVWLAYCQYNYAGEARFMHAGSTPLTAAMRCYVASELGDEVDVPEELV